ncbi:MAG: DUF1499 domain-containing protein [Tabrizicola sp.]
MSGWLLGLLLVAGAGGMAYIRLAPSDPKAWHVDFAAGGLPAHAHVFCIRPDNRYGPIQGDPAALLARLDAIALATPRTERLAGSPEEGRITWVTRSGLMGYPDYTTAQVMEGPGLCIAGRQRFGSNDWGVNARRIGGWVQELLGLPEPPEMTGL